MKPPPPGNSSTPYNDIFRCSSRNCAEPPAKDHFKCEKCLVKHYAQVAESVGVLFITNKASALVGAELDALYNPEFWGSTTTTRRSSRVNSNGIHEEPFRNGQGTNHDGKKYNDHTFFNVKFLDVLSVRRCNNRGFERRVIEHHDNKKNKSSLLDGKGPFPALVKVASPGSDKVLTTIRTLNERPTPKERSMASYHQYTTGLHKLMEHSRRSLLGNGLLRDQAFAHWEGPSYNKLEVHLDGKWVECPPNLFSVAEMHASSQKDHMSFFEPHCDKEGSLVCFYCVKGHSYNIVVVEDGTDKDPYIDWKAADGPKYKKFQEQLSAEELKKMEDFELAVKREATQKGKANRILVYHLSEGQYLIFNAGSLLHGTVVPANTERCIVILHRLELYPTQYTAQQDQDYQANQECLSAGIHVHLKEWAGKPETDT